MKGKKAAICILCIGLLSGLLACSPKTPPVTQSVPVPTHKLYRVNSPSGNTDGAEDAKPPQPGELLISEAVSSSHLYPAYEGCEGKDWFELYNASAWPVDLSSCYISDDAQKPLKRKLPAYVLQPGEYVAVCCCKGSKLHPSIDLGLSREGETLCLYTLQEELLDSLTLPPLERDVSWAKGDGIWGYCLTPTPNRANSNPVLQTLAISSVDSLHGLVFNEALLGNSFYCPDEQGRYNDYVELYNGGERCSLQGLYLSDGENNLEKWPLPDTVMEQGSYLVLYLDGLGEGLHAGFSWGQEEERLYLYDPLTRSYCSIDRPERTRENVSFDSKGQFFRIPTPGNANGKGVNSLSALGYFDPTGLYISEVCSFTDKGNDWIELYNGGKDMNLKGWRISDSLNKPGYVFEDIPLSAGGFHVLETSSHPSRVKKGMASMGISLEGETLYLLNPEGQPVDVFTTGALKPGLTAGRIIGDEQTERVYYPTPSKGKANGSEYLTGYAPTPVFSETGLYQRDSFSLRIEAPGATVYYTLDGSKPGKRSKVYSEPLNISKNTVIRAISVQEGRVDSPEACFTYLFEEPHSLPVVSVFLSPKDKTAVWSSRSKDSSSKVEREGYLGYYEADGGLGISFPTGFKAKGAGTLGRKQPSLSVLLRGKYGQGSVSYPFFEEYGFMEHSALVLRNAGQDYTSGRIRDSLSSRLCMGLNVDVSATRPVAVYVNGEYYGLYDLNEDQNADYLHTHYGIDNDTVETVRYNTRTVKGSNRDYKNLVAFCFESNMSRDSNYEKLCERVDVDYYTDYLICSMYLCNIDMANQKHWHTTDNTVRWRAILYDFDYAIGFSNSAKRSIIGSFFTKEGVPTATDHLKTPIPYALSRNRLWREKFIERYVELVYTAFDPQRCSQILDRLVAEMEPEMARHIQRWGSSNAPASVSAWKKEIEEIRTWLKDRPEYALKHLQDYFDIPDSQMKELKNKYKP